MKDLQVGDVLICKGKSIISKAILTVTRSKWSHAAIVGEVRGEVCVIEAQRNGVNLKLWNVWVDKWGYTYEIYRSPNPIDSKKFMVEALELCGETKYDYFTFFRRAFGDRKQRSDEKENKKFICSELVAYLLKIPCSFDIIPDELREELIKLNYKKI